MLYRLLKKKKRSIDLERIPVKLSDFSDKIALTNPSFYPVSFKQEEF